MIHQKDVFTLSDHLLIVNCSGINSCEYATAVLKGKGLNKNDIIRPFGALIKKKLRSKLNMKRNFNGRAVRKS